MKAEEIDTSQMKCIGTLQGTIAKGIIGAMEGESCIVYEVIEGKEPTVKVWIDNE
jgi:hypothetical protein